MTKKGDESSAQSSYLRSSTPVGQTEPRLVRWDPDVFLSLKAVASVSNASMNFLVNQAVSEYLAKPEIQSKISKARADQDEAIRKLAGG